MEHRSRGREIIIRLDQGDEIVSSLIEVCREEGVKSALVSGIGAVRMAGISHFDSKAMQYRSRTFEGMYEVLSLKGNISTLDGGPFPHLHIVIAGPDMLAFGGHLNKAEVDPACEIALLLLEDCIRREKDERTGLNLQRF